MEIARRKLDINSLCVRCGADGIIQSHNGKSYCLKHYEMETGGRDKDGYKPLYEEEEKRIGYM